jgi:hypothetical protein
VPDGRSVLVGSAGVGWRCQVHSVGVVCLDERQWMVCAGSLPVGWDLPGSQWCGAAVYAGHHHAGALSVGDFPYRHRNTLTAG